MTRCCIIHEDVFNLTEYLPLLPFKILSCSIFETFDALVECCANLSRVTTSLTLPLSLPIKTYEHHAISQTRLSERI